MTKGDMDGWMSQTEEEVGGMKEDGSVRRAFTIKWGETKTQQSTSICDDVDVDGPTGRME
jgi:hypothetical protein